MRVRGSAVLVAAVAAALAACCAASAAGGSQQVLQAEQARSRESSLCGEHGAAVNGTCACEEGWTGSRCTASVRELPAKQTAPGVAAAVAAQVAAAGGMQPTADYDTTLEDRWACPGGCSGHGECNPDSKQCMCDEEWFGEACQHVRLLVARSDPSLRDADRVAAMATALPANAQATERQQRMLEFLDGLAGRITSLEGSVERGDASVEDKEELSTLRETAQSVGGFVPLSVDDGWKKYAAEEAAKRAAEEASKRAAAERAKVVQDAVQAALKHAMAAKATPPTRARVRVPGEFKLFSSHVDMEHPTPVRTQHTRAPDELVEGDPGVFSVRKATAAAAGL